MQREKERVEALRRMAHEDYLQTPEWQETRKAALKRAGKRCQVCRQGEVALDVYHTTYETLGCEQESDVIALCEACYDLLSQQQKLATGNDSTAETGGEEPVYPHFSLAKKVLIFTPTALTLDGLLALLHAPLPAELFGLGGAIALAVNSPKIYAEIRDSLPPGLVEFLDGRAARKRARAASGDWNNWDRLLGRHLRDDTPDQADADDTTVIDEEDIELDNQQDLLDLGPTLQPHADSLLSKRKVILGTSGSGKTNTMIVYCEELGRLDPAPALILFDTDDENRALCNRKYLPNPAWLDKSKGLTPENAFATAQTILERRYQCIVNLQSYEDEEAAWIMIHMIQGVRAWQEAREIRIPCEIVLDEASVWLPQNPRESVLSSILIDDPDAFSDEEEEEDSLDDRKEKASKKISLLALLQRVFFTTVRRGRRRGMGFTLAAQRIAEIDKRALQGSWMFLMRQTQPADFREYQKYGISPDEALGLLDGEAFVFAPGMPREKHRLRESDSPHGGVTPGMKALRGSIRGEQVERGAAVPPPPQLRSLPASARPQYAQQVRPDQPPATSKARPVLQEQIAFPQSGQNASSYRPGVAGSAPRTVAPESQTRQAPSVAPAQAPTNEREAEKTLHFTKTMGPELQAAYEAYQPGMHHHTLARQLGITPFEAGQLLKLLQQRGLIDAAGNKKREKVVPILPQTRLRAADIDLDEAIAAWNAGHNSEDKLMRRFPGLTKYQAGLLRDRIVQAPVIAK